MKYRLAISVNEGTQMTAAIRAMSPFGQVAIAEVKKADPPAKMVNVVPFAAAPAMQPVRRMTRHESNCNGLVSDSFRGRLILAVFKHQAVCRPPDFTKIFLDNGYSATSASAVLDELLKEKAIVRVKRGVYRLPLDSERVESQSA